MGHEVPTLQVHISFPCVCAGLDLPLLLSLRCGKELGWVVEGGEQPDTCFCEKRLKGTN